MQEYQWGYKINDNSGFKGRYIFFKMDGTIAEGLSYSYRQRINALAFTSSFFDATDWLNVTYEGKHWGASAGKQVVAIGGYEYDGSPIDIYFASEFWNNIPCFQLGVSGFYKTASGNDKLTFQITESPFRRVSLNVDNEEMFSYNLMWSGSHGFFKSLYSFNMIEYLPGKYVNYITLGNRFEFNNLSINFDIMNRSVSGFSVGENMSFMGRIDWKPLEWMNVFAKATYDFNHTDQEGDWCVTPGTDIGRYGLGLEFWPVRHITDLRLHINYCYSDGINGSPAGALRPKQSIIDAGVTWKINALNIKRKK